MSHARFAGFSNIFARSQESQTTDEIGYSVNGNKILFKLFLHGNHCYSSLALENNDGQRLEVNETGCDLTSLQTTVSLKDKGFGKPHSKTFISNMTHEDRRCARINAFFEQHNATPPGNLMCASISDDIRKELSQFLRKRSSK